MSFLLIVPYCGFSVIVKSFNSRELNFLPQYCGMFQHTAEFIEALFSFAFVLHSFEILHLLFCFQLKE